MGASTFIVVHDYGQGSIGALIDADDKAAVEAVFDSPSWSVYEPGEEGAPEMAMEDYSLRAKLESPNEWLKNHIYSRAREQEGKAPFSFRSVEDGRIEYWCVWARSESEIISRYPWLTPHYGVGMGERDLLRLRVCDIDSLRDFLRV